MNGRLSTEAHAVASARAQIRAAERMEDRPELDARPRPPRRPRPGLVTRTIAFAIDAAIVNAAALAVAGTLALAFSILHLPHEVRHILVACGGAAFVIWVVVYFTTFWATTGQTPANRLIDIRVCDETTHEDITAIRSIIRFAGLILCAIPLGAGFLPILFDERRRGLHDRLAHTVVLNERVKPLVKRETPK